MITLEKSINIDNTLQGEVCFLGAISQVFYNHGIFLPEEVLYGLGFGLQFRFKEVKDTKNVSIDCMNLLTDFESIKSFLNSIGVDISFCFYDNIELFQKQLIKAQKTKETFIAAVDSYGLSYSPTFLKKHDSHVLVAQMLDTDVLIQDNYVYTLIPSKKKSVIKQKDFIELCNLNGVDSPHTYMVWFFNIKYNSQISFDLEYIRNSICKSSYQMNNTIFKDATWYGINGLTQLHDYLIDLISSDREIIWKAFGDMNEMISARGGLYQSRKLFSKFLDWVSVTYELPFTSLSENYHMLSQKWKLLSTMLLKAHIRKSLDDILLIKNRLYENVEMEKLYINKLIN